MMSTVNKNQPKPSTSRDLMTRGLSFISEMKFKKRKMVPIRSNSNDASSRPRASTSPQIDSVPLVEKIAPTCSKDLIVHPRKIKEVVEWMEFVFDDRNLAYRPLFLVISGPSGSGKTTTLKLLAKERNIEVVDYKDPMYTKDVLIEDLDEENALENNRVYRDHIDNQSQLKNFKSFLIETNTFFNKKSHKRIIIIEEMPHTLQNNPESYQEIWLYYKKRYQKTGAPIVIMLTSDHPDDRVQNRIFPNQAKDVGPVKTIRFNAMTQNQTTKFLSKKIHDSSLNPAAIHKIFQGDRCDLRSMVNFVELKYDSTIVKDKLTSRPAKKRKTSATVKGSESGLVTDRDHSIQVNHFVAKILYAKRDFERMPKTRLPSHLKEFDRRTLVEDPCRLAERSPIGSDRLILYLFENYTFFCVDIHHAPLSVDWLSIADSLTADIPESTSFLEEYRSIIASAGLMFNLCPDSPMQAKHKGRIEIKYHHHDRFSWNKMESTRKDLNSVIYPKRPDDLVTKESDEDINTAHGFHSPRNLLLDILPYLSVMKADSHPELRRKYDKRILSHSKFGGIGGSSREPFAPRSRVVENSLEFRPSNDIELVNIADNDDLGTFIDSDPDDGF
ncbi:rad17 checkpoint clamp loader component [Brevipalpus obovatus]|uniref:rad17 checkpoint clamp loader component n=1 Tax=Brevipalpus obovatus TaxID=246614 RepID=UPI003D9F51B4